MCSAAASHCRDCTNATLPRAGGRRWGRPCIASPATGWASSPARYFRACSGSPDWPRCVLGFAFGWTIFQALFMRDMAGGSYLRALKSTFISELLSMNLLMAGMVPTVMALKSRIPSAADPATPQFWFVMSMGLLVGFIVAYPMNWWLVAHHLKHGMMTVR